MVVICSYNRVIRTELPLMPQGISQCANADVFIADRVKITRAADKNYFLISISICFSNNYVTNKTRYSFSEKQKSTVLKRIEQILHSNIKSII